MIDGAFAPSYSFILYFHIYIINMNRAHGIMKFIFQKEGVNMDPKEIGEIVVYTPAEGEKVFME